MGQAQPGLGMVLDGSWKRDRLDPWDGSIIVIVWLKNWRMTQGIWQVAPLVDLIGRGGGDWDHWVQGFCKLRACRCLVWRVCRCSGRTDWSMYCILLKQKVGRYFGRGWHGDDETMPGSTQAKVDLSFFYLQCGWELLYCNGSSHPLGKGTTNVKPVDMDWQLLT